MARTPLRRAVARVAAGALFAGAAVSAFAGTAMASTSNGNGPGGNNGTVKIGSHGVFPTNANEPHLSCPIDIQWTGFDAAPSTHDYTVNFTAINPTGGTASPASVTGQFTGDSNVSTFSPSIAGGTANNKGEYHLNIDITTSTSIGSDKKSKTIWMMPCNAGPAPSGTTSLSGTCNSTNDGYDWSVATTPAATSVDGTWGTDGTTQPNAFTTGAGGTTTFTTGVTESSVYWQSTDANFPGSGNPTAATTLCTISTPTPTDASATASADCSGFSADLTPTNATGGTDFDVIVNGVHHSVPATAADHVHYGWIAGAAISVVDAAHPSTVLASANAPTSCGSTTPTPTPTPTPTVTPPASIADPTVDASKACKTGITVELGDLNGTAPVTFTVTKPNGSTETVDVRSGEIVKKSYAVGEDTTGVVIVTAPGLSKKTVSYSKNCTTVLGEKVVKTPKTPKTPKKTPVVQAVKVTKQLPFTGLNTAALFRMALILFVGGALLLTVAGRRPRRS